MGEESNLGNAARQTRRRMTFHNVASNGGFVSPPGASRSLSAAARRREISVRSYGDADPGERRRKFALSHRTPGPSITAAAAALPAVMRARDTPEISTRRRGREHPENLTSGTPVKLAANKLHRNNKRTNTSRGSIDRSRARARKRAETPRKSAIKKRYQPSSLINRPRDYPGS